MKENTSESKVIIIPNEEDINLENGIWEKPVSSGYGHDSVLSIFSMLNSLKICLPVDGLHGYFWGKEIAAINHMVIIIEGSELYLFIPSDPSDNQFNWFYNSLDNIKKFKNLEAGIYNNNCEYQEIFKNMYKDEINVADYLISEMNRKKENQKNRKL